MEGTARAVSRRRSAQRNISSAHPTISDAPDMNTSLVNEAYRVYITRERSSELTSGIPVRFPVQQLSFGTLDREQGAICLQLRADAAGSALAAGRSTALSGGARRCARCCHGGAAGAERTAAGRAAQAPRGGEHPRPHAAHRARQRWAGRALWHRLCTTNRFHHSSSHAAPPRPWKPAACPKPPHPQTCTTGSRRPPPRAPPAPTARPPAASASAAGRASRPRSARRAQRRPGRRHPSSSSWVAAGSRRPRRASTERAPPSASALGAARRRRPRPPLTIRRGSARPRIRAQDIGDEFDGTLWDIVYKGAATARLQNIVKPDAMVRAPPARACWGLRGPGPASGVVLSGSQRAVARAPGRLLLTRFAPLSPALLAGAHVAARRRSATM